LASYYVYILTNKSKALYTGVTNDLKRRVYQHRNKLIPGFTCQYNLSRLTFFEMTTDVRAAISREKQIKGWTRRKKLALIESANPRWRDLSVDWYREEKTEILRPSASE
jgi:putative endonuclease